MFIAASPFDRNLSTVDLPHTFHEERVHLSEFRPPSARDPDSDDDSSVCCFGGGSKKRADDGGRGSGAPGSDERVHTRKIRTEIAVRSC